MPLRPFAHRLALVAVLSVFAVAAAACDQGLSNDVLTPEPVATDRATATPPSASQIAQDNMLGLWRRREAPLDPTVQDAVVAACRAAPVSGFGGGDGPGDLPVAVIDARGMGRVTVVFADDARWSACLATVDDALAVTVTAAGQPGDATVAPVGENEIAISALEVLDDLPAAQRSVLIGRVGKNAYKTTSGFDDQTYVDGPHDHGWYTMWWPGNVIPAAVAAEDMRNTAIGAVTPER